MAEDLYIPARLEAREYPTHTDLIAHTSAGPVVLMRVDAPVLKALNGLTHVGVRIRSENKPSAPYGAEACDFPGNNF